MSRRAPAYTPLCNKILRFYFSDPQRTEFISVTAQRQFEAVKLALKSSSPYEIKLLHSIVPFKDKDQDLLDSYIQKRLLSLGLNREEQDYFYNLLRSINYRIAVQLGYIERKQGIY